MKSQELLELHRASAGSGKTYTLAKKFLWYFLTIRDNHEDIERFYEDGDITSGAISEMPDPDFGPRRLRNEAELRDSLKHILAVTFTNKATNEMKERIVEKLNALAYPSDEYKRGNLKKEPDYMRDFIFMLNGLDIKLPEEEYKSLWRSGQLDIKWNDISAHAKKALFILLENYSDFQVSTIDSFFQMVLRTFAYETDLNDSFAIELDSEYLSKVSIDATLQDIEGNSVSEDVKYWIKKLMENERNSGGNKWNLFLKSGSYSKTSGFNNGVYGDIISYLKKLDNEDFKKIRSSIERYFESSQDLRTIYEGLNKATDKILKSKWSAMVKKADILQKYLNSHSYSEAPVTTYKKQAEKIRNSSFETGKKLFTPIDKEYFSKPAYLKRRKGDPTFWDKGEDLYNEMMEAYDDWINAFNLPEVKHWIVYRSKFPYLGLLQIVMKKRREYLEANNSVELGETNTLLHKIIGEDETPFIYERLGTRLNHYLIDEFQDTSELQWQNFKPLLQESLGRGNENLLIGDAKQSIYRFRNADSSLISSKVDENFADNVKHFGDTQEENTNYRSSQNVISFNNGFFDFLKERLNERLSESGSSIDFSKLYSNVVQNFSGKKNKIGGYVEVNFIKAANLEESKSKVIERLPELINELRQRGYKQKDIAVLIVANADGTSIIDRLTAYNASMEDSSKKIEFVSEDSLKLSRSVAVKLILNTLTAIAKGVNPKVRTGEDAIKRGVANWQEMESNFRVFALKHPELSTPEKLQEFLASGSDNDAVSQMLADMEAVTLPALVENISATFLPEDIRKRDLAFISAFQDIVLEYCESHPSDIASFLLWWERRGRNATITSPENMDAVKIMTIHKSKGLEFKCVIIPFAETEFNKGGAYPEWRWVKPYALSGYRLPDYLPVETSPALENTEHWPLYREYLDLCTMDNLNKLYVGFTRAINELYIFCKEDLTAEKSKDSLKLTNLLKEFIGGKFEDDVLTAGEKYPQAPSDDEKEEAGNKSETKTVQYKARTKFDFLKFRADTATNIRSKEDEEGAEDYEDTDPRSEGNIFHAVMENIQIFDDIPAAVSRLMHKGLLPYERMEEIREKFEKWLSIPEVKHWFDGTYKVKTERSIVKRAAEDGNGNMQGKKKSILLRPDRIMEGPDGSLVIVDYKFGSYDNHEKYKRQIRNYVLNLKSTARYSSVKGYLWYVKDGQIIGYPE